MPLQVLTPDQIPALTRARLGIFARNGAGKTTFAATIPELDETGARHRVMAASVDIENIRPYTTRKHYRVTKLSHWNDLLELYELVEYSLRSEKMPVTDVVFDTWSRMQDLAIGKVTGYNPADPEKLRQYIERIPKRPEGWNGWGQVGALMNEWMGNFNRLPVHLYYLVQENDRENRTDNYTETGPRLTPEANRGLRDALEVIGRLYVITDEDSPAILTNGKAEDFDPNAAKKGGSDPNNRRIDPDALEERRLFIGQHERYQTKGPTHLLGRVIANPTWTNTVLPILTQRPAARGLKEVAAG